MQKLPIIIKASLIVLITITIALIIVFLFIEESVSLPRFQRSPDAPTNVPIITTSPSSFVIAEILPTNTSEVFFPVQEISIVFNSSISPSNLKYSVEPDTLTRVRQGSAENILIISPETIWKPGNTTITVLANTSSQTGTVLTAPRVYTFKSNFPENPIEEKHDEEAYPPSDVIESMKREYL